ncbi:MAG: bifunctional YncE family protein/alkaline phosphatase family protein [Candidatus Solibacter usitatus]|nr:bifunctional YncE family protein/alkaline phosphatase family protein [Candidatus Solibacter usitatus]
MSRMNTTHRTILIAALAATAGLLVSQPVPPERVGPAPDGSFLLNSGARLRPAGRQIPLSTFPMASALSPDGKHLVILQGGYMPPSVSLHDPATLAEIHRLTLPDAWLGLVFAPAGNVFYVGGGSRSAVYEVAISAENRLELRREFAVVPVDRRKHTDFIGDVTMSPDGRLIYAAALFHDSIVVINPQSGMVIEEWKTGHRPYRVLFHPDGKSYFVTGWGDSSLYRHNAGNGEILARYAAGTQPMDMAWRGAKTLNEEGEEDSGYRARLFVTAAGTNNVLVFGVGDDGALRRLETINVELYPKKQPAGMTPAALALSPEQDTLYVVCSDLNAVARVDVRTARSVVQGFIPTGWYPTAARVLSGGRLMVLNGRGQSSFPNPQGPNPTIRRAPVHEGVVAVQYVGAIQNGSASLIPAPSAEELDHHTRTVLRNSPYRQQDAVPAGIPAGNPLARAEGKPALIEHVIYVVKENRTYDQVLGDLGIGNGDPSLCLFTEEIAPNHHKLAREFVLLDNFYVSADVSADGHNWSTSAIAPPYVQRMWPNSYAGRRRHYDYEGGERAALPPAGYIWSNALQKGLRVRNYGWWATNIMPAPQSGPQISAVRDPALAPHTNLDYRSFDLDYKDLDRLQVFLKDLQRFESEGRMPSLITLRLGNDHTSGTAPKKYTPKAAMADNDMALGMLVEALSRSRFWAKTAIFVLEDDAQNGPDHVDSHRSPAYIISPYTRNRGIDSSMYNTVSVLRTIEVILGLAPMTMHDAGARVMWAAFRNTPDLRPYQAEQARVSTDERNPEIAPTAARSRALNLDEADRADDDELNDILWRALRGAAPPPPVRSFWGR